MIGCAQGGMQALQCPAGGATDRPLPARRLHCREHTNEGHMCWDHCGVLRRGGGKLSKGNEEGAASPHSPLPAVVPNVAAPVPAAAGSGHVAGSCGRLCGGEAREHADVVGNSCNFLCECQRLCCHGADDVPGESGWQGGSVYACGGA